MVTQMLRSFIMFRITCVTSKTFIAYDVDDDDDEGDDERVCCVCHLHLCSC